MTARCRGFAFAPVSLTLVSLAFVSIPLGASSFSYAQDYPSRFIRVLVGPGPDITARLFGGKITDVLGQQVVVEPRPGAGGTIAAQAVAGAPPDGYTLLLASASYTINTAMGQSPLDLGRNFAPIGLVATVPFVLVVHPALAANSLAELVALAKANPGKLNYASSGIGTPPHLAGELFKSMAGVDIVHVPFREANTALNAVVSGSVQIMFSIASTAAAQMSGGTVRGIGVTSATPSPLVPGLPAIAQSGLAGFTVIGWNGFVAPKGTSPAIIDKLNAALQRGLDDPPLRQRLASAGYEPAARNSPADFARFIQSDTAKWLALVEKTNMKNH
jgi:tripartite-type tricarboxylate transporter receptor subunit TctC